MWLELDVGELVSEELGEFEGVMLDDGVFDDDTDVLGVLEGVVLVDGVIEGVVHCTNSSLRDCTVVEAIPLANWSGPTAPQFPPPHTLAVLFEELNKIV